MKMMKIKWIVFDMDGTLLDSNKQLPKGFFELKEKLENKGIQFILASGRQYARMRDVVEPFGNDFLYISDNGTLVFQDNQKVLELSIEQELSTEIIKLVQEHMHCELVINNINQAYMSTQIPEKVLKAFREYYQEYELVDDLEKVPDVVKISLFDLEDKFENIDVLDPYQNLCNITHSGATWTDIVPKDASKGIALKHLAQLHNVSTDEIMVFGDAMNDYDMLHVAGHPIIMANADPRLKDYGFRETLSNDENGVMVVLEEVLNELQ